MALPRLRSHDGLLHVRPGRGRRVLSIVAAILLLVAVVGLVAHFRASERSWALGVSAFSPYLMLAAPVAAVLLVVARQWLVLAVAVVVVAVCVGTQSRFFTSDRVPADPARLVMMTCNLRLGEADPAAVVRAVREHRVDLLSLQELTGEEQGRLEAAGLDDVLPHHAADARGGASGTGLWSRYPLTSIDRRSDFTFALITATVAVPGAGTPVGAVALHLAGPVPSSTDWHRDIRHLPDVLRGRLSAGPVVVGGDFNATPDIAQFRAVLVDGYADGAHQAGAGITATYPAHMWYPPLIAIDHVLTHGAVATSARTLPIAGSDHRALVVSVALPRRPAP
jgi:endonuclease/exonuclease/phosphatase (EEP) superfamily protein YafD